MCLLGSKNNLMRQSVFSKLRKNCRRMTTGKKRAHIETWWCGSLSFEGIPRMSLGEKWIGMCFPWFSSNRRLPCQGKRFQFSTLLLHRLARGWVSCFLLLSKEKPLSNYLLNRLNKVIKQHHNGELLLEKTSQSGPGHPELVGWKGRRFWESFVQNLIDGASYLFAFGFA